jgi:hypothetical protein
MNVVITSALDLERGIKRDVFFGAGLDVNFLQKKEDTSHTNTEHISRHPYKCTGH